MSEDAKRVDEWGALGGRLDEDYPKAWRPGRTKNKDGSKIPAAEQDGDTIMGTVIRTDMQRIEWQGAARMVPVAIIATHPTGEVRSVWCMHKTLAQDYAAQAVPDGSRVAIKWLGEKKTKDGGNTYHAYKLVVQRPSTNLAAVAGVAPAPPDFGDEAPY